VQKRPVDELEVSEAFPERSLASVDKASLPASDHIRNAGGNCRRSSYLKKALRMYLSDVGDCLDGGGFVGDRLVSVDEDDRSVRQETADSETLELHAGLLSEERKQEFGALQQ